MEKAKKGRPKGSGFQRPPDDAPEDVHLSWALSRIGTFHKSMDAAVLAKYPEVLNSPRVRRLVTSEATDRERATVAHDVLMEIFGELVTATDRLVAEAILGAGQFAGKEVYERTKQLGRLEHGCSKDGFKRRRPRVLIDIVEGLLADVSPSAAVKALMNLSNAEGSRVELVLQLIASEAAELYFAGLGLLFSRWLDEKQGPILGKALDGITPSNTSEAVWFYWPQTMFYRFGRLMSMPRTLQWALRERAPHDQACLDDDLVARLARLHGEALACGPFAAGSAELATVVNSAYERVAGLISTTEVHHEALDLLAPAWVSWCQSQLDQASAVDRGLAPDSLGKMLRAAASIEREASQRVHYRDTAPMSAARSRAHRALSYYHDIDGATRVLKGMTLRVLADRFFDFMGPILAKEAIAWDDVKVKVII